VDYDQETFQTSDTCLDKISDCQFSYSDGLAWKDTWSKDKGTHPTMVKITFRFSDETKERDFVVNIPLSP
jgi:hypothetical protein